MSGRHGRRPHVATWCGCQIKVCFTTYDAAMARVANIPGAERAYRGPCCGHYHITGLTQDEFAQLMAERSVQAGVEYGTVVPYDDTDEGQDHEAERGDRPDAGPRSEEQGAGRGRPRA